MRKYLVQKDEGSIISMFSYIFGIFAMAIMLIFFIGHIGNLDKKDSVTQMARQYILKMETTGYMDSGMLDECNSKLSQYGNLSVDAANTTSDQAQYGGDIILTISGELYINKYSVMSLFKLNESKATIPFTVRRTSTAKY